MKAHFSSSELQSLVSITHQCIQAKTQNDVRDAFESLFTLIPFKAAGIGTIKRPGLWINHSFETSWTESYLENGYHEVDPVVKTADQASRPFTWEEARCLSGRDSINTKSFLNHAKKEGVYNGIAVSNHDMENGSMNTLVTLDMGKAALPRNWMVILQLFVAHLHEAFKRLHQPAFFPINKVVPLTSRETETLNWAKEGKSAWEIGMIMGISERTVKFHFSNIYAKLNVVNRAQAVALGVSCGMI